MSIRKFASALVGVALLAGCATSNPASTPTPSAVETPAAAAPIQVASLKGPTSMGLSKFFADGCTADTPCPAESPKYQFSVFGTADEIVSKLDSFQAVLIPANLAAVLNKKTEGAVQVAAINTLGVLHVVAKGEKVASFADLEGKTIYSTGKGTTPQYVFEHLLSANKVKAKVEYLSEATEVAAKLTAADKGIAVLPEPYVTVVTAKDPSIKSVLDLSEEWSKVDSGSQLVTGVLAVKKAWADANRAQFEEFLNAYGESVQFTNQQPEAAGEAITALGITPSAQVAAKAIPGAHIVFISGDEVEPALGGYLQVLFAADPKSVGGAEPGADLYWK
ncbi:MAG: ABC transporter substrate-binding protein [Propionibacteriaceae bacterium]|jgi:NitT/TauT family transport system substrate-binding protein|nr:ABC transporter substrate-binding protein [Propionibacteriaceae bacterium]